MGYITIVVKAGIFSPRHMGCDLVLGLKVIRVPGFVFFLHFDYVL